MSLVRLLKEQFFIDDDTEVNGADLVDFLAEYLETVPEIEGSLNVPFLGASLNSTALMGLNVLKS